LEDAVALFTLVALGMGSCIISTNNCLMNQNAVSLSFLCSHGVVIVGVKVIVVVIRVASFAVDWDD
jgi:hypothetical protein